MGRCTTRAERLDIDRRKEDRRIRRRVWYSDWIDFGQDGRNWHVRMFHCKQPKTVDDARRATPRLCRYWCEAHGCPCYNCKRDKRRYVGNSARGMTVQERRERSAAEDQ